MRTGHRWKTFAALTILAGTLGCSSAPHSADPWKETSVRIEYVLGHSHRRIVMEPKNSEIQAESFLEAKSLKRATIDAAHYQTFLTQLKSFVDQHQTRLATGGDPSPVRTPTECSAPYTVTVITSNRIIKLDGCRQQDQGAFSHLIQNGEFLIYSQK